MTATFDSFAWIEYFAGSKKGEKIKRVIESNEVIYTPSICLLEIKSRYIREGRDYSDRIKFVCFRSSVTDLTKEIALRAAEEKINKKLYAVDAVVYATSRHLNSILWTGDQHLKNLEGVEFL